MSVEHGDKGENGIESVKDENIYPIIPDTYMPVEKKLSPIQRIKGSLGLNRKSESIALPEQEDPEFIGWLESISLNADRSFIDPEKIPDPELAKNVQEILQSYEDNAARCLDDAKKTADPEMQKLGISVGKMYQKDGWSTAMGEICEVYGDDLLEYIMAKARKKGELDRSERIGLSSILTQGLATKLMIWGWSGDDYEDSQDRPDNDWPNNQLKSIFREIKSGIPQDYHPDSYTKGDFQNYSPLYAILTYERAGGSKDLLIFAMEKLEKMSHFSGGGIIGEDIKQINIPVAIWPEGMVSCDCLILAARLARLIGNDAKQQELYHKAYDMIGETSRFSENEGDIDPKSFLSSRRADPILLKRITECVVGADLPQAEEWEKIYEEIFGKKFGGKKPESSSAPNDKGPKVLSARKRMKELPDKFA